MHAKVEQHFRAQKAEDVVFFHLQTVFEGGHVNTPANGKIVVQRAGIQVPVGYDAHVDGARTSIVMSQYGTGGTPWTIVVDKKGVVSMNQFSPANPNELIKAIEKLR